MEFKPLKFIFVVVVLVAYRPQACSSQFFYQRQVPQTGSISRARNSVAERQLDFGALGLSQGISNAQTVTKSNGGYGNGGTTSVARSRARKGEVNLAGLNIGSTLTNSQTRTNGAVSRGISHDLNVGGVGIGTSLSRENFQNGFGLRRSQNGGVQFGLGALNFDLSRHQQQSQALTQAQAEAQGADAFARSRSNSATRSQQFGGLGLRNSRYESDALSATTLGQTSASAGGLAGGGFRGARHPFFTAPQGFLLRSKRNAQLKSFAYINGEFKRPKRQFGRPFYFQRPYYGFEYPQEQSANAEGSANNVNGGFEQQAGANSQSNQEFNEDGFFQNNDASSIGSNLAEDGSSGQLSSANVNQESSFTEDGSQSINNAQSQALNFDEIQQQAANANAGTMEIHSDDGERIEAQGGAQTTNNNQLGTSSNIANANSAVFAEGDTHGSQADSSSQSVFQGTDGSNSAANSNANVNSLQGPDGFVSNTASSSASAVSRGGQSANAVASASANSDSNGDNSFSNANADSSNDFGGFGGAQANSGAYSFYGGARGFSNGQSGFQALQIRKSKSIPYNLQPPRRQQTETSTATLEIMNDSRKINWPKNRIQQKQSQQWEKEPQQLHYSSINSNSSTEQFAVIDENERHERTFTFITDLINSFRQPKCIYPCTLDAYQKGRCCETVVATSQPSSNVCCQHQLPPLPQPPLLKPPITTILLPPSAIPTPPLQPLPIFPLIPTFCCNSCPAYAYYRPPCTSYTFPGGGAGRVTLYMG